MFGIDYLCVVTGIHFVFCFVSVWRSTGGGTGDGGYGTGQLPGV